MTDTSPASQTSPPGAVSYSLRKVPRDLLSGLVVFLVALPLCLGIALASNAPLASGLIAGIVGGLVVGLISGSHTSVAGPAAGLTAVVVAQIGNLGSFAAFLAAVFLAGVLQVGLGLLKAGNIAAFVPTSVIKGLLAAIGITLILKQIPHLVGHDPDPEGELSFIQPDGENTFSELLATLGDIQPGAALVGFASLVLLILWIKVPVLAKSPLPGQLVVVVMAIGLNQVLGGWTIGTSHLVQVPQVDGEAGWSALVTMPDWSALTNSSVVTAAITVALVASLETLLNLEAVDKLDPKQRESPPNRELLAQGVGNMVCGLFGGLPVTSVIVRSSVNISAGNETKISTVFHGVLLVAAVLLFPNIINMIPLSGLAAILLVTGFKLASPKLFRQMWAEGRRQFLPFLTTVAAIVLIDLLWGVIIGLAVSVSFILASNFRRPLRQIREHHLHGDVLRIELATQVGFFSRAAIERALNSVPAGGHVLIDARLSDYIDPDVLGLLDDFKTKSAPAHGVNVSTIGLRDHYSELPDEILYVDYSSREVQSGITPKGVREMLEQGNQRFRSGVRLTRDLQRQVEATAPGQAPLAVVLSCIDSRAPTELIFDQGIGDIFSVRIAGNVAKNKVLASLEYACVVAGAKLVVVLGHTSCGAITTAVDLLEEERSPAEVTGCDHIDVLVQEVHKSVASGARVPEDPAERVAFIDDVTRKHVIRTMKHIRRRSGAIDELCKQEEIAIVGGMYNVHSGAIDFFIASGDQVSLPDLHLDGPSEPPRSSEVA